MLTLADKGEGGIWQMLTLADKGVKGVIKMLTPLTKNALKRKYTDSFQTYLLIADPSYNITLFKFSSYREKG